MISNIKKLQKDVEKFREDRTTIFAECVQGKLDKSNENYLEELKKAESSILCSTKISKVLRGKSKL